MILFALYYISTEIDMRGRINEKSCEKGSVRAKRTGKNYIRETKTKQFRLWKKLA